jgi:hypothetical protein
VVTHFDATRDMASVRRRFFHEYDKAAWESMRKLIYAWRDMRSKIQAAVRSSMLTMTYRIRRGGSATVLTEATEKELVVWIDDIRSDGIPVTGPMLAMKAQELALERQGLGASHFRASHPWRESFLDRHHLSLRARTRSGKTTDADGATAVEQFAALVKKTVEKYGIIQILSLSLCVRFTIHVFLGTKRVLNADQTAVFFEYLPSKSLAPRGASRLWIRCAGKTKDRLTAMLLADTLGNKFPLFLIFKSKAKSPNTNACAKDELQGFGKAYYKKTVVPLERATGAKIYGNKAGWWNEGISIEFLKFNFGQRRDVADDPVLLLWDDFKPHFTPRVKNVARALNVHLLRVPPGFTWACQPADLSWNKPLKDRLRGKWVASLYSQLAARADGVPFTFAGPKRDDVVGWVVNAWDDLTDDTVIRGFSKAKLLPTSAVDMSYLVDDNDTSSGSEDDGDELDEEAAVDEEEDSGEEDVEDDGRDGALQEQVDEQGEEERRDEHDYELAVEAVVGAMVHLGLVSRTEIFANGRDIVMAHEESTVDSSI